MSDSIDMWGPGNARAVNDLCVMDFTPCTFERRPGEVLMGVHWARIPQGLPCTEWDGILLWSGRSSPS